MDRYDPQPPADGSDEGYRQPGAEPPWGEPAGAPPSRSWQPAPPSQSGGVTNPGGYPPAYPSQPLYSGQPAYPSQPLYQGQPPYPPQYPGWPGGGYQAPPSVPLGSGQYPGQYAPGQPPPWGVPPGAPPPRGAPLSWWQWLLIAVGGIMVLCCGLGALGVALRAANHPPVSPYALATYTPLPTDTPDLSGAPLPTDTPVPSGAPQPTDTPVLVGPPQSGIGTNMMLGADYAPAGQGFSIVGQTGRFASGDPIALLVNMNNRPFGTTSLQLILARVDANGTETVVDQAPETITNSNFTEYAIKWPNTGRLMGSNQPGVYKFELTDYHTVLAQASFNYLG